MLKLNLNDVYQERLLPFIKRTPVCWVLVSH